MTLMKRFLWIAGSLGLALFLVSIPDRQVLGISDELLGGPSIRSLQKDFDGADPCAELAHNSVRLEEIKNDLPVKKELAAETVVAYNAAAASKKSTFSNKKDFLDNHPVFVASPKYTSYFEMDEKKKAIIDRLEKEIASFSNVSSMLSDEGSTGANDCAQFAQRPMRDKCNLAKAETFRKLQAVFSVRVQLAKNFRQCVMTFKNPGFCKDAVVRSDNCPLTTKSLLQGLVSPKDLIDSYGGNTALLNAGGDICALAKKEYLALIADYGLSKSTIGESAVKKETSEVVKEFGRLENNFAAAASRELQAKVKMSEANGDLAAMEARQRELTDKIKVLEAQCADAKCTPVITVPANVEKHEIDKVFQKMPVFTASGKPAGGEWSFQALWAYNRVVCNYPPAMAPKVTGEAFDSSVYNDKIFGGDVRITYSVTCPKGKMSAVYIDKIIGENPDVSQVHTEIDAQLKNWNLPSADKSADAKNKEKTKSEKSLKVILDEASDLEILEKIVCQESSYRQFFKGKDFPYADNEMDIGLFQIRTTTSVEEHCDVAWDWRHNVRRGVEIYAQKRKESLSHNLSEANPAYGNNVDLQRCICYQIDYFSC